MANTFRGLIYEILACYSDDTLIYGGLTIDEHINNICLAIDRCWTAGLHLDISKCKFFALQLEYLGFQAIKGGIKPLSRNVEKITKLEISNVRDIRSFIGLANFYRRFVQGFAQIVQPLNVFLQKNARLPLPLPAEVSTALERIKTVLTSYPVLRNPDLTKPFILETDGSLKGIGVMLLQVTDGVEHPVAYASSGITAAQKGYSSPALEALGSVFGMIYFKHYLVAPFTLRTDQVVLKWLYNKKSYLGSMTGWVLESQSFTFTVVHVPGRILHGPDLLSRAGARFAEIDKIVMELGEKTYSYAAAYSDMESIVHAPTPEVIELTREVWILHQEQCSVLQKLVQDNILFEKRQNLWFAVPNTAKRVAFKTTETLDYALDKLVVPLSLRYTLLSVTHGLIGHRGTKPIEEYLNRTLYWIAAPIEGKSENLSLRKYVRHWIRACADCNKRKFTPQPQPGLTQVSRDPAREQVNLSGLWLWIA